MTDQPDHKRGADESDAAATKPKKDLPPAAQRALAEAEERRRLAEDARQENVKEVNGPNGPEPTRYGDWEKGGLAIDF